MRLSKGKGKGKKKGEGGISSRSIAGDGEGMRTSAAYVSARNTTEKLTPPPHNQPCKERGRKKEKRSRSSTLDAGKRDRKETAWHLVSVLFCHFR